MDVDELVGVGARVEVGVVHPQLGADHLRVGRDAGQRRELHHPTAVAVEGRVDNNGNEMRFTYEERKSNNKPTKFLRYLTDATGRQTLTIDYYAKGQAFDYINDTTWTRQSGTNLTNPKIIDHVSQITDISGRKLTFTYTDKGLLGELIDGAGSTNGAAKTFKFAYDMTQGNKNVKLVKTTDPRGNATDLVYHYPQAGDDPKWHWRTKSYKDRLGHPTTFAYVDPDGPQGNTIHGTVTDAENHATQYQMDGYGRPVQTTNAKNETTKLGWDDDHNVIRLEKANTAVSTWAYDQKTGYPTEVKDAEAVENNTAGTVLAYQRQLNGYVADLVEKTSPEGRKWTFGYESDGDLSRVTDPKGNTTADENDYTTRYTYDAWGQMLTATDANGNTTTNNNFDPNGYPQTIIDALTKSTTYVYDERGQVLKVTDALGKDTTQTYDTFGRPLVNKLPKKQATGEFITAPAPEYDANDNVTKATAPNGAVSTAVYDEADQIVSATAPKDSDSAPERTTTYTYDKTGHVLTTTEPKGNATTNDATDYTSTNTYNEIYQLIDVVNALGDKISYRYDNVGNVVTVIDPKKNATPDPNDYSAKYAYDLRHRLVSTTDALGKTNSTTYDKDSLTLTVRDVEGNETLNVYDERGKQVEVKVPYSSTTDGIVYRTTRYEYDQVGNTVRVINPRGTQTANPDDFATRTEYDALNRPVKQFQPYDPADARYSNAQVYTQTFYDEVGRVSKISMPPSEGQTTRNATTYTYFDNGWVKSSTDPWDIVTTYDYNELGLQTSRTLTSADGDTSRTMGWSFHPNGALKAKTDDGVPVGSAVPLVDNSDVQHVTKTGTWAIAEAAGQQGIDHQVHAAGAGTDTFAWTLNIPKDGRYTAYVKFPAVAGAATAAKFSLTHSGGTTDKTVDQTSGAGTWVSLGAFDFTQGNGAKLTLAQNAGGVVVADGVKLVRDTSGDTDQERHDFRYAYDLNGNLMSIEDNSSGATIDAYTLAYTELNQVKSVTEAVNGETERTTSYTYDPVNNPLTVNHPKQFSSYTYDLREKVASVSVGDSAGDPSPQVSSYTYTDRGQLATETKGNGNVVTTAYYANQSVRSSTEKKADGTVVASHTYEYDANGNKAKDVAAKMNADNHSSMLSSTTVFSYDPADRIAKSVKTGNGATTETYVHDDNANVISQSVGGVSTTFRYDRNRLQASTTDGAVSGFTFDPFGRQESVTRGGQVVSRSVYDGFDRVIESQQRAADGTTKSTTYAFDPLDRTLSTTADGKTTDYTYLGLSDEVLLEEVNGQLSKSYQYSPWGQRLSQVKHNDNGTSEDSYYGYNSHTDVETLTGANGDTKATYGYTAYGNDDKSEFTGIDKPDPANPTKEQYNSFRYNAKRWDPNSETYDMGFRDYSPGLNRFTTRDMYNGALADMGLGNDPFTGNRYAFTGGNPISNVEIDGHYAIPLPAVVAVVAVVVVVAYVATQPAVRDVEVPSWEWPKDDEEPEPKPTSRPPGPGTDDTDEKKDCTRNGQGWAEHGERDAGNGNRATGVEACLTAESIKGGTETTRDVRPPGYNWARRTVGHLGSRNVAGDINNCHLLGNQLGGSGTDLKNLATCSAQANYLGTSKGTSMAIYEGQVRRAVENGETVHYTVTPLYDANRTVPVGFQMTAYGTKPDGTTGLVIDDIIPNTYNGTNLGGFNAPNSTTPVPTGAMS
ncbi:DNA/RNA non-specific endonuclease [Micromonospora peucetia]|uniref:golvesin C-terminal-like domain-containing protein n=1 Tax=Micromonospora peucetia TaxID=47871 RepID=UPI00332A1594